MKRIFIISLFVMMLMGCTNQPSRSNEEIVKDEVKMNVTYSSGVYHDKNWDDETGTYTKNVVPNAETAAAIASAIFAAMDKTTVEDAFTLQNVFYDEVDGLWIISFGESIPDDIRNSSVVQVGYSCSIAIKEADGTVLRIWFGE